MQNSWHPSIMLMLGFLTMGGCSGSGSTSPITTANSHRNLQPASQSFAIHATYSITDLGTLGGTFSQGDYVNANGAVSGFSTLAGDTVLHAFLWENGALTDLGSGFHGPNSAAIINNASEVATGNAQFSPTAATGVEPLFCQSPFVCHAAIWMRRGTLADLGTLGGPASAGLFINNNGQVVGVSETTMIDPFGFDGIDGGGFPAIRGFVFQNGKMTELGTLGGYDSIANANNDLGQAGGTAQLAGGIDPTVGFVPQHPVTWTNGVVRDLGTLGGKFGFVESMNSIGQVSGISTLAGEAHSHGFIWQDGVMTDVGTLPGDTDSDVSQINNIGEGVGFSANSTSMRATILRNGVMTDLNTLVPPNSGYQLVGSTGNNDRGQIVVVAVAVATGETHAVLLTPSSNSARGKAGGALLTRSLRSQLKKRIPWARLRFLN